MTKSMIPITESIEQVRQAVNQARAEGKTIGLVPTMGALHAGHSRLVELSAKSSDFTVVSIFVNPTQFGPKEDYSLYPRTLDDDRAICEKAGAALIFAPTASEIYPTGDNWSFVEVPRLSSILEGASRPGHFRGVATVVLKLFQIVQPDIAWFGLKDYQQTAVIRRMVADLNVPVKIRLAETVRELDGLAMSSRNRYLNPEERKASSILYQALKLGVKAVQSGERDANVIRQILRQTIASEPLAQLDYAEVADAENLEPLTLLNNQPGVALVAVRVGPARLIDNVLLPTNVSR